MNCPMPLHINLQSNQFQDPDSSMAARLLGDKGWDLRRLHIPVKMKIGHMRAPGEWARILVPRRRIYQAGILLWYIRLSPDWG